MTTRRAILWLRRDLRLDDHQALTRLLKDGYQPIPVYLHEPAEEAPWAPGAASLWWLHHSLSRIRDGLRELGSDLIIRRGPTLDALRELIDQSGAEAVYWHRLYAPSLIERDSAIKAELRAAGIAAHSCSGHLIAEPDRVVNQSGGPYRVFTPYWRNLHTRLESLGAAEPAPSELPPLPPLDSLSVEQLGLLPKIPWDQGFYEHWVPGEAGAQDALARFAESALEDYGEARDRPDKSGTSTLSPHLHFGEISVRRVIASLAGSARSEPFLRELGWRDYSYYLLRHFPQTTDQPLNQRFEHFAWAEPDQHKLAAWQRGNTGVPIVDAGMRQLWASGWMHNRVRMIVASLLTKNLRYHWLHGARWFWDTLVDADLASNSQGWQWTAGTGVDAAPYFRIFNPVSQGERFDPQGDYVRRWVPELGKLPNAVIHQPWKQGRVAGYPSPIVDLQRSRAEALDAFKALKEVNQA